MEWVAGFVWNQWQAWSGIRSLPQIVLLAIDFHKDFIDEESIAVASVFSLQSACVNGTKFDTPQADCFSGYSDASFSEQIFDIAVT